jgi:hypothetical protein
MENYSINNRRKINHNIQELNSYRSPITIGYKIMSN